MNDRLIHLAFLAALSSVLAGCAGDPTDGIHVTLIADKGLNPSRTGVPDPVQVRLYLLNAPDKFRGADFFQLSDKEAATLGSDLASRQDETVRPGETREVVVPFKPSAHFLGVAVAYRTIDTATWRLTLPLTGRNRVVLGPSTAAVAAK